MVHAPSRGDGAVRLGPDVPQLPDYGPSVIDADVYRDPVRYQLERRHVLATSWLIAGRSSQVAQPGDWITYEGHGEDVVVTRQPDGSLAAFHNVCQHRGPAFVPAAPGCGARRFKCPYHGWVYDTTGRLVGVPDRDDFDPAVLQGLRAPVVQAEDWGGWVWINLASGGDVPSLVDWMGPEIAEDLARYRMEDMVLLEQLVWDVPVSYKAIVDGFNEIYHATELHHVPPDHTKTHRQATFHIVGRNSMMFVPRTHRLEELRDTLDHLRYTIGHYVVFPNSVFNCNPEPLHIQVFNPIPVDVDRTRFICWELAYGGDEEDPEYEQYLEDVTAHWRYLKEVVGEDIAVYDLLAKTKQSSAYRRNVLSSRECKIAHYHDVMDEMISAADDGERTR